MSRLLRARPVVYFGDAPADERAAADADVAFVGVGAGGFHSNTPVVPDFVDLPRVRRAEVRSLARSRHPFAQVAP